MSDARVRVIKLGGSLLDWPELPAALRRWRQLQPPMRDLMIVGGGAWADLVRDAHVRYRLDEEQCHWLCLRLMSVTARLAASMFPEAELISTAGDAPHLPQSMGIMDVLPLLEQAERTRRTCGGATLMGCNERFDRRLAGPANPRRGACVAEIEVAA